MDNSTHKWWLVLSCPKRLSLWPYLLTVYKSTSDISRAQEKKVVTKCDSENLSTPSSLDSTMKSFLNNIFGGIAFHYDDFILICKKL